jgi:uncharacterized protein
VLFVLASCSMQAQEIAKEHFVRANGEATVSAKPDRAEISIGVITQASSAQAAAIQNATQTTQVLSSLKQTLGSGGEIKTSGYSISPQYYYAEGKNKLTGYQASNTVLVTVNDLSLVGKVIDSASSSGANNINNIAFSLRNDAAVRQRALAEATANARAAAEAIAKALDVRVVGVLRAETTQEPVIRPINARMMAMAANAPAAPTPVETGDVDVHAAVTVTVEVQR